MKNVFALFLLLLPLACPAQTDRQSADDMYTSLHRFMDINEGHPPAVDVNQDVRTAVNVGYMLGLWDGLMFAAVARGSTVKCVSEGTPSTLSMARNYTKYLDDHPDQRTAPYQGVFLHSVTAVYPCLSPSK